MIQQLIKHFPVGFNVTEISNIFNAVNADTGKIVVYT